MARKVIGLVGCGLWGTLVLRDLSSLDAAVVVADTDDAARASATALGATAVRDAGALPDVDALVVATPAVTHADIVDALLPRGVPLLVEKPFTTSIVDAERLVARGGDRLFVGHVWRYHPGVEQLGEIARSGDIGPIAGVRSTRTNWTSPRTDVDSIWNLAPHDLTLAIEIVGGIPAPRAALAEVQDGRAVGLIEITRGDARTRTTPAIEVRHVSRESALRRQLAAFLGVLDGGPPPKSTAAEGLDVVKAVVRLRALAGLEN
jgi:predicted dehydrogenase